MPAIMIDLETLSTHSNAFILSIGAVQFDVSTGKLGKAFYQLVDGDTWSDRFHIDPATFRWWLAQSTESRGLITAPGRQPLPHALVLFEAFMRESGSDDCEVWGNGATFDNVILRTAYQKFEKDAPWKFWNDRCFRTFKNLYKASLVMPDAPDQAKVASWGAELPTSLPAGIFTAHSALGDAICQARGLLTAYGYAL